MIVFPLQALIKKLDREMATTSRLAKAAPDIRTKPLHTHEAQHLNSFKTSTIKFSDQKHLQSGQSAWEDARKVLVSENDNLAKKNMDLNAKYHALAQELDLLKEKFQDPAQIIVRDADFQKRIQDRDSEHERVVFDLKRRFRLEIEEARGDERLKMKLVCEQVRDDSERLGVQLRDMTTRAEQAELKLQEALKNCANAMSSYGSIFNISGCLYELPSASCLRL